MSQDFNDRLRGHTLVTLNVIYYMPDHRHVLNEFIWQTQDISPKYPRIRKFLDFWRTDIDAVIKEVLMSEYDRLKPSEYRNVTKFFEIH